MRSSRAAVLGAVLLGVLGVASATFDYTITAQVVVNGTAFPHDSVQQAYSSGFYVTSVGGHSNEWVVVMSKMEGVSSFTSQVYQHGSTFPSQFMSDKWAQGYWVTELVATLGGEWFVAMSKTSGDVFAHQEWRSESDFPKSWVQQGWDNNMFITDAAYDGGTWYVLMSNTTSGSMPSQNWATRNDFPNGTINTGYENNRGVTELTWTGSVWLVVMTELWFESGSWVQRQYWENAWPAYQVYEDWGKSGVSPSGAGLWITEVGVTSTQYGVVATTLTPLPDAFESTSAFSLTPAILDQEECGSCWAFAAVEAFADRLQVSGQVTETVVLSPQVLVSCSTQDDGCDGGWDARAWDYLVTHGTTTCTDACTEGCVPYSSGSCVEGHDPAHDGCEKCTFSVSCVNNNPWPVRYIAASSRSLPSGETFLQEEIRTNGPVETCFSLYHNFYTWDWDLNPVYTTTDNSSSLGGHCVKIMGWGVTDDNVKFWKIQNSWGEDWGLSGYFLFLRGEDFLGIESGVVAGYTWRGNGVPPMTSGLLPESFPQLLHAPHAQPPSLSVAGRLQGGGWANPALQDILGDAFMRRAVAVALGLPAAAATESRLDVVATASILKVRTRVVNGFVAAFLLRESETEVVVVCHSSLECRAVAAAEATRFLRGSA